MASAATPRLRQIIQTPGVVVDDVSVTEADPGDPSTTAEVHLRLTEPSTSPVSVKYALAAGTAKPTLDYVAPTTSPTTVTFAPNQTDLVVMIPIVGDALTEADETFTLKLGTPTNAVVADPAAVITIVDEDPLITLTVDPLEVTEGDPGAPDLIVDVVVHLNQVAPVDVTVDFATKSGTATIGRDYQRIAPVAKTLTIPEGELSVTVPIRIVNDGLPEVDEVFQAKIANASGARIVQGAAPVTIIDKDPAPVITLAPQTASEAEPTATNRFDIDVAMNPPSAQDVTVLIRLKPRTTPGSATGADFSPTRGSPPWWSSPPARPTGPTPCSSRTTGWWRTPRPSTSSWGRTTGARPSRPPPPP